MLKVITKRLIGIEELSQYLDIPVSSLYFMRYQRRIPYVKIGRTLKFDKTEIDKWIEERKVKANEVYS
jgi:excisionase family DNA binding protein